MSEPLPYDGVVSSQIALTIVGSSRNAFDVSFAKIVAMPGDRMKVTVAAVRESLVGTFRTSRDVCV
jgi:hypothetical protein